MNRSCFLFLLLPFLFLFARPVAGQSVTPLQAITQGVGIDQHLDAQLPPSLTFKDETGSSLQLKDLQRGKPIILVLVQYRCPSLCTAILNDMLATLKVIPQTVGNEYDVWTVSFDSKEKPDLAAAKKQDYLRSYNRTRSDVAASAGWHFLTGDAANISALTSAVGYRYRWDEATQQFIHPAALILLTPEGKISRYFFGVDYDPTDVRLSLVEASHGKIGNLTDKLLLFCYHYDPATGRYGLVVANAIRIGGLVTVILLFSAIALLFRADRRRTQRLLHAAAITGTGEAPMNDSFRLIPESASNLAGPYDQLFLFLTVMTAILTFGIATTILIFILKYRRRHPGEVGKKIPSSMAVEITWTVIPLIICLGIFRWSALLYVRMSRAPDDAMVIQVVAKQWMWKIQHPNGRKEINELHVPLGQAVKLQMTSQDVIHSFYVPAFRIKQDVLPGRYSEQWFIASQLGEYHLFCAEYCGTSHALMGGRVVVMTPGDYAKWSANAALDDRPEVAGSRLFAEYGCIACHGQQAPTLAGIYNHEQLMQDGQRLLADENYLRESILDPRAKIVSGYPPIMPAYRGQLSEEQVFQIISYIKSLESPTGPPPAPTPLAPVQLPPSGVIGK